MADYAMGRRRMTLSGLTRDLYHAARIANKIRIAGRVLSGHPESAAKAVRTRFYLRTLSRFMR
jgi:hypothetical protein